MPNQASRQDQKQPGEPQSVNPSQDGLLDDFEQDFLDQQQANKENPLLHVSVLKTPDPNQAITPLPLLRNISFAEY